MNMTLNQIFNPMTKQAILKISLCLLPFLPIQLVSAQGRRQEENSEKVMAAKVAYITSRLNLNTTQAQQFWPVYNEFEAARKKIRAQMKSNRRENKLGEGNEEQLKGSIKKQFSIRQEELDLEKLYSEKFMKILSAKQVADFYESEKEFTKLLLRRLKNRNGNPQDGHDLPD